MGVFNKINFVRNEIRDIPGIVTGNNLIKSGKNSVLFVKDTFIEVVKLRAGYFALCWIVGISAYVGAILLFSFIDIVPLVMKYTAIFTHFTFGLPSQS